MLLNTKIKTTLSNMSTLIFVLFVTGTQNQGAYDEYNNRDLNKDAKEEVLLYLHININL